MRRAYDVVEEYSNNYVNQLKSDVDAISKIDIDRYDLLCDLNATRSKTYKNLVHNKGMIKKKGFKKSLELCEHYTERYPYDAFILKSHVDEICKENHYSFAGVSQFKGELSDTLIIHMLYKKAVLKDDDAIFYIEDTVNSKAGFFSQAEIIKHGYEDRNRYDINKAEIKILAPLDYMEVQKWAEHPSPKSLGCSAFVHVVKGYLQIAAF